MKLPGSKKLFLPILKGMASGEVMHGSELLIPIQHALDLTEEQMSAARPNARQPLIYERITGSIMHLVKAGLVERVQRGHTRITQSGLDLLATEPIEINYTTLRKIREDNPNIPTTSRRRSSPPPKQLFASVSGMESALEAAVKEMNHQLVLSLAAELRHVSAADLDRIVCELLEKLGYGSVQDESVPTRTTHGSILKDALGLNHAYVRITTDTKPDLAALRTFAYAMDATQTDVGVFVAPRGFSSEARGFALGSPKQIVLLGSEEVAQLMFAQDIGVAEAASYVVQRLDEAYLGRQPTHNNRLGENTR